MIWTVVILRDEFKRSNFFYVDKVKKVSELRQLYFLSKKMKILNSFSVSRQNEERESEKKGIKKKFKKKVGTVRGEGKRKRTQKITTVNSKAWRKLKLRQVKNDSKSKNNQ